MGVRRDGSRLFTGFTLALVMLVAAPAANAWASARVRLVNAAPGSQALRLTATPGSAAPVPAGDSTAFGHATPYAAVPAGSARLELAGGAKASATEQLADGARYTAIAYAPKGGGGAALKVLRDGDARGRRARLRVVHVAPELGSPNILLGRRTIAEALGFRSASPYLAVAPGSYALKVARPGGGSAIFEKRVALSAGSATTVVVAGSAGAAGRLIALTDDTVTPAGPPETGLGGLAGHDGPPWLLAALAAALAGLLGGAAQLSRAAWRSGRR
jgi:hypothetical protein